MSMLGECSRGPWRVRSRIGGNEIRDADGLFVAPIDGTPATERLVAAAPELYNALFDLLHILDRDGAEEALLSAIRRELAKVDPADAAVADEKGDPLMSMPEEASAVLVDRLIREAVIAERQRCIEDVCAMCGGRALGYGPVEPANNGTGNWVHPYRGSGHEVLCGASTIHQRIARENGG